ncbi:hypothetical protein, partial [Kangiella shandongensis]|uniref:hypothetical protein n=1 Tax=Kangiella shandongensis TaxID=2763258 RepID=UPI001CC132AF
KERLGEELASLKWAHIIYRPNLLSIHFDNFFKLLLNLTIICRPPALNRPSFSLQSGAHYKALTLPVNTFFKTF